MSLEINFSLNNLKSVLDSSDLNDEQKRVALLNELRKYSNLEIDFLNDYELVAEKELDSGISWIERKIDISFLSMNNTDLMKLQELCNAFYECPLNENQKARLDKCISFISEALDSLNKKEE